MSTLHFALRSVRTRVGAQVDLQAWAEWARIPHRGQPGNVVDGALMTNLLGITSKAWEPETFRDPALVARLGHEALEAAHWTPDQLDALVLVSCTPFEHGLDQDAHRFGRMIGLPDDVPVLQMHAGCAGLARAMAHLRRTTAERVLLLTWNAPGAYMRLPDGTPNPLYRDNNTHPDGNMLWFSPALFSDGAAAATFERKPDARGIVFYSRDAHAFDGGAGFHDPLVVYPGGGAFHPPGAPGAAAMSAFGMHGPAVQTYYTAGMLANGRTLEALSPDYAERVSRIYTHQASPRLIRGFLERSGLPAHKVPRNCERVGNLVSVSTLRLLDEDLSEGRVRPGDELCFSVVGAGPERGAFILPYCPPEAAISSE